MKSLIRGIFTASIFWYCYDDWLAALLGNRAVGEVPFFIWLIVFIALGVAADDE